MTDHDALAQINDPVRIWYGPGFIRSGHVIDRNEQDRELLVKFDYDIPDAWVRDDQLC